MFANPCDPDSEDLMDTVYIDNLGDAMYTVRVNNVDANGRESLVEEKYGSAVFLRSRGFALLLARSHGF